MTQTEQPLFSGRTPDPAGKADVIFGRIDLIALVVALLGVCAGVVAILVLAIIEVIKLFSIFWANHDDRWLAAIFAVAVIWVIARWKRLCIF